MRRGRAYDSPRQNWSSPRRILTERIASVTLCSPLVRVDVHGTIGRHGTRQEGSRRYCGIVDWRTIDYEQRLARSLNGVETADADVR